MRPVAMACIVVVVAMLLSSCDRKQPKAKITRMPDACDHVITAEDVAQHCGVDGDQVAFRVFRDALMCTVDARRTGSRDSLFVHMILHRWTNAPGAQVAMFGTEHETAPELQGIGDHADYFDHDKDIVVARLAEYSVQYVVKGDCSQAASNALADLALRRLVERVEQQ